jgi:hypothetical protein
MIAIVLAAALVSRAPALSPEAALSQVERALPFPVLELPSGAQLEGAALVTEPDGAPGCRLDYAVEGLRVHVEEREPASPAPSPPAGESQQIFSLDGYPAMYSTSRTGYTDISALTWYRQDLTVRVWAADGASPPLLVNVALELR